MANGGGSSDGGGIGQGEEGEGVGTGGTAASRMFCSPQLLRFAAHLALLLAAQCPYLTMEDETAEAIEDVVCAYAEHLASTKQVRGGAGLVGRSGAAGGKKERGRGGRGGGSNFMAGLGWWGSRRGVGGWVGGQRWLGASGRGERGWVGEAEKLPTIEGIRRMFYL